MNKYNRRQAKELAAKIAESSGDELSVILLSNLDEFQVSKREIAEKIAGIAVRHPDKNISELLDLISAQYTKQLKEKQTAVVDNIINETEGLTKSKRKALRKWQREQTERIAVANREGDFKNKYLVRSFSRLAKRKYIDISEAQIESYFDKLPNSKRDVEAFVVKYKRRPPNETAFNMIKNTEPTLEHIIPFSETGDNTYKNILIMCEDCNSGRGKLEYKDFLKVNPNMVKNTEKYFSKIREILNNPATPQDIKDEYKTYINDVKHTLHVYTEGKL